MLINGQIWEFKYFMIFESINRIKFIYLDKKTNQLIGKREKGKVVE